MVEAKLGRPTSERTFQAEEMAHIEARLKGARPQVNILLTGSEGMLGYIAKRDLSKCHYVCPTTRATMDVTRADQVRRMIQQFRPEVVIHLAACTSLEFCQDRPQVAYDINVAGTEHVAKASAECGARVCYLSTGAVFDGTKHSPYVESDVPNPLSVYGKTKLLGEQIVQNLSEDHLTVRTGWLFGGYAREKKFVGAIMRQVSAGCPELYAVDDIIGSPTFTVDLVERLSALLRQGATGIYHVVNSGYATRHAVTSAVVRALREDVAVRPVSHEHFRSTYPAPRQANERLATEKPAHPMRAWEAGLAAYVKDYPWQPA